MDELITPELDKVSPIRIDYKMEIDLMETKNENWNPLTQEVDLGETLLNILEEVRSLRDNFEKSDAKKKQQIQNLKNEIKLLKFEVSAIDTNADPEPKLLPKLPINALEDLKEFDDKLPLNDDLKAEFINFLKRFSGQNFIVFLKAGLRALVTDELAVNLTWRGTPEKPSIQTFTVFVLLREICLSKYSDATQTEINRLCQQHFLHAKDRVLRKNKGSDATPKTYVRPTSTSISREVKPMTPLHLEPLSSPLSVNPLDLLSPSPSQADSLPRMPFKTLRDLEEFDDQLLENRKLKKTLTEFIKKVSNKHYAKFIRDAYRAIMTDEVATQICWRGTKEKQSIQEFNIFVIIRDTCHIKFRDLTNADIDKVCKQHFLHATDRLKKKLKSEIV